MSIFIFYVVGGTEEPLRLHNVCCCLSQLLSSAQGPVLGHVPCQCYLKYKTTCQQDGFGSE